MKFTVYTTTATEFCPEADEHFAIVVENSKGRRWVSKHFHACPGNAAEEAMVLGEYLNDYDGKLVRENWDEV